MSFLKYPIIFLLIGLSFIIYRVGFQNIIFLLNMPRHDISEDSKTALPLYDEEKYWAHLPTFDSPHFNDPTIDEVDVFFVHPTAYFRSERWNDALQSNSTANQNIQWMVANQASVFQDFPVYMPRYREATIYSFFNLLGANEKAALKIAYHDVERAFDYFLKNYSRGRPFILAAHGQGSFHSLRLLQKQILKKPLERRLVAAYIVGGVKEKELSPISDLSICDAPLTTGCLAGWSTYASNYEPTEEEIQFPYLCVNPLSWKYKGDKVEKERHLGMVESSGELVFKTLGDDIVENPPVIPAVNLSPPEKEELFTSAECGPAGTLLVNDLGKLPNTVNPSDYHNLDYNFFYLNIKENAVARAKEYLRKN